MSRNVCSGKIRKGTNENWGYVRVHPCVWWFPGYPRGCEGKKWPLFCTGHARVSGKARKLTNENREYNIYESSVVSMVVSGVSKGAWKEAVMVVLTV